MELSTATLIGSHAVPGTGPASVAHDPATNLTLNPAFPDSGLDQVDQACRLAEAAFDAFRAAPLEARAGLLEAIATQILALGDDLLQRAGQETGLPRARLDGERARTVGQLRMFAGLVRAGRFLDVAIDRALPERKPLARPDLRLRTIPLGPVAVFGASNFPLAFSVAGGDTASALAAGCPVIVKAHPAHPGASALVGGAIQRAVASADLPAGVFSMIYGHRNAVGEALVQHPLVAAVGFTGSRRGGLALASLAAGRPVPIPVYAEMSSVNPVFLLPAALATRGVEIAGGFVNSLTLGTGQFCTQPGLAFAIAGPALDGFLAAAAKLLAEKHATPMLTGDICEAYRIGLDRLVHHKALATAAMGHPADGGAHGRPALFTLAGESFQAHPELAGELFGPSSLVVACRDTAQLLDIARGLEGQLTATLQIDMDDHALAADLLPILERKAGRILANGFPTGVEVSYAMVHGGPFPATSDSRTTSVGAAAIERFLRPVCYQDLPQALLAPELREGNPLRLPRLVEGRIELA